MFVQLLSYIAIAIAGWGIPRLQIVLKVANTEHDLLPPQTPDWVFLAISILLAAALYGLVTWLFSWLAHRVQRVRFLFNDIAKYEGWYVHDTNILERPRSVSQIFYDGTTRSHKYRGWAYDASAKQVADWSSDHFTYDKNWHQIVFSGTANVYPKDRVYDLKLFGWGRIGRKEDIFENTVYDTGWADQPPREFRSNARKLRSDALKDGNLDALEDPERRSKLIAGLLANDAQRTAGTHS